MTRRLVVAPPAQVDLDQLASFIAEDSLDVALRFYAAVEHAFARLLTMPEIGVTREFTSPRLAGLRMWPVPDFPNHLIFYRPTEVGVEIVRVLHAARDIPGEIAEG